VAWIHSCRCHVCGREFDLRTIHLIDFEIRWPDERVVYACDRDAVFRHSRAEVKAAWLRLTIRGQTLDTAGRLIEAEIIHPLPDDWDPII
jgi:hypothetical protein